jgi:phosphoglycerate dehydrogenase-like enzyme
MRRTAHVALKLDQETKSTIAARLDAVALDVVFVPDTDALVSSLPDVELLLLGRPPRIDWSPADKLTLLHVAGAGVDPLFPAHGLRTEAWVTNCRGTMADAVRDHVLALVLAFARDLPRCLLQQQSRVWKSFARAPLAGQRVCVVGLGEVGRRVAEAAIALGMKVRAVSRSGRTLPGLESAHEPSQLSRAVSDVDYVVLCLPLTSATLGLVDDTLLGAMGPNTVVIDVSRGGIVDTVALERRLRAKQLGGAALDVFDAEPLASDSSLWGCPGLLITPHCAGFTMDYVTSAVEVFVEAIASLDNGATPVTWVSRQHEY